jgi:hypothetical protein
VFARRSIYLGQEARLEQVDHHPEIGRAETARRRDNATFREYLTRGALNEVLDTGAGCMTFGHCVLVSECPNILALL